MNVEKDTTHVMELGRHAGGEFALLHSFDVDRHTLERSHARWLDQTFREAERTGDAIHVWVMGLASRTASNRHNLELSQRRASAVVDALRSRLGDRVRLSPLSFSVGEMFARVRGVRDGVETSDDRAVLIGWWKRATGDPPPPAPVRPRFQPRRAGYYVWSIRLKSLEIDRSENIGFKAIPAMSSNRIHGRFEIKREPGNLVLEYDMNIFDWLKFEGPGFGPTMGSIRDGMPKEFEKAFGKEFPTSKWMPFKHGFTPSASENPIRDPRCMFRTKDTFGDVELRFGGPLTESMWQAAKKARFTRPAMRFAYSVEFDYTPSGLLGEEFYMGDLARVR
ncbi:MAG: hypothetical protein AAF726_15015 [Planctomycetota bacterium]